MSKSSVPRVSRRRPSQRAAPVWLCVLCVLGAFPTSGRARRQDTVQDLEAHIQRESNPVKKAKLEVKLARLEATQAASAYDRRQFTEGRKMLAATAGQMQDAWKLLQTTGRNAARKPDGFMQLEIGSRESARILSELRQRTFYLYRGPIDESLKTLNAIHSQVLVALFPGAAPPAKRSTSQPKASAYQQRSVGTHP